MTKYILLSHKLGQETPSYGNRDRVIIRTNSSIKSGETANSSCWILTNNHIGTHIDVPKHFSDDGYHVADIPINDLFFHKVELIDIPCDSAKLISPTDIEKMVINPSVELLLIRTGFEKYRQKENYWSDNPGLASELADYLRSKFPNLRCIGFDFISITSWKYRMEGRLAHKFFLCPDNGKKPILAIEDMSLMHALSPIEKVIIAPLYVEDGNGAAVTVFAEINKNKIK